MNIAIYPGSFDPVTKGHLNIIERASKIFDRLIVCVMVNAAKRPTFSREERVDMLERVTRHLGNVEIDASEELLAAIPASSSRACGPPPILRMSSRWRSSTAS